jgi:mRNA interferase RelE/StbE
MLGNKKYKIQYENTVTTEDIPALPLSVKQMIKKAVEDRLMVDPVSYGKPLRFSLKGHRRLRVSDYRIIYRIDHEKDLVIIVAIKHRRIIYE